MKFIVDGEFWKTACKGVKCCDCTMFDEKHDCRINTYIHKQPVYREERKASPSGINWQYCKNLNDINRAIKERDENWEGLKSAEQIISITWDSHQGCYVVFWKESDGE